MEWLHEMMRPFEKIITEIRDALFGSTPGRGHVDELYRRASNVAPVIWLVGKTGSGKSAIVATLTGNVEARVGEGFEPCTRTARLFEFPPEAPLVRFLDTRGLEEPGYDATEDLAWCEGQSHLLLAVMRVDDPAQASVLNLLRAVRKRHPEWPLMVAQTALHAFYGTQRGHPAPYPFGNDVPEVDIPFDLRKALAYQRSLFDPFFGQAPRFVPIDFTRHEDGFSPVDFGVDALLDAVAEAGFQAVATGFEEGRRQEADQLRRSCRPLTLVCAVIAAGGAAIPVPFVDFGTLTTTNGLMLKALADRYETAWTLGTFVQFFGAIGGGTLAWWGLRFGAQELLKLIPVIGTVGGAALNATAAFSLTFGIGEAACVWLGYQSQGRTAPDDAIRRAFKEGMRRQRRDVRMAA